jgi:hypothetical protein
MTAGDMDGLVGMLAADAVVTGDAGDTKPNWPRPIIGRDKIGRLLAARSVINRDKLRHLGPLADLPQLIEQARVESPY